MQKWVVFCLTLVALAAADECPDGRQCEKGQTCCNDPANGYECCPFEQAECCADHTHCCPAGTVCSSGKSSCVNATSSIPWVERANVELPKRSKSFRMIKPYMGEDEDNICPDQSRCPPEFSCLTALRGFGCCPIAQGVPCSDGKHCCPMGRHCSADSRSCTRQAEPVTAVLCSDGVSECPLQTTCCESPEGKWGCCPMPKAVCCEDKLHCCPDGTSCDVQNGKCISLTTKNETPMWAKLPARIRAEWENKKEAGQVRAAEKSPKVMTANRVPPSQQEASVSSVTKENKGNDVPCNDTVACEDGTTCCKTKDGGWACCPLPEAVCCDDFIHCCPKGSTCDLPAQSCDEGTRSVPWLEKKPAQARQRVKVEDVPCDSAISCPDNTTCCKTKEGGWACCPMPEAVCCDDFIHCCPKGSTCDLPAQSCDDGTHSVPWLEKKPAVTRQSVQVEDVPCDSTTSCSDNTTCCKTKDGSWACCPLPEAVCCDDFIHCCPKGSTCDLPAQSCDDGTHSVPWLEKKPAVTRQSVQVEDVPCDSTTSCSDNTTCCKTKDGSWACCPLPEAVCCDDFIHCCPKGSTCDLPAQSCDDGTHSVPWLEKKPAVTRQSVQVEDVPCDSTTSCSDNTTCCKTKDGSWACCPLPEAVCCDDFIHCCPKGSTCDLPAQSCDDGTHSVPWLEKKPAVTRQSVQVEDVPCDSTTSCSDNTTCCKTKDGSWACCPLPEAVCCDDFIHCCPKGSTCDLPAQSCDDGTRSVPWLEKKPALTRQSVKVEDVPCDSATSCPDKTTCCKTKEGGWACCPIPEAVCCDDFIHCCPKGMTCDVPAQSCDEGTRSVPWLEKKPAVTRQSVQVEDVPCDSTTSCSDNTTCCKTKDGGWACCPLPEAVCCDDHEHCCPAGTTCDLATLSCKEASGRGSTTPMKKKLPAFVTPAPTTAVTTSAGQGINTMQTEEKEEEEVRNQCDAHTSCPKFTTCCFMASSQSWGCCPLPEAVCCTDGRFCCPAQYTCNEGKRSCVKGEVMIPWYTKLPATTTSIISVEADRNSVQCDVLNKCPERSTCCRLLTGAWGCCPLQNAVCCTDKEHCCPQGFHCNVVSKSCQRLAVLQLETVPLTPVYLLEQPDREGPSRDRDIQCEGQTSCTDMETCCRTSATSWGCCPAPNAVCCSDMKHCCPSGYTCTTAGSCTQNMGLLWRDWHMFLANKKRALIV
nr:granulin a isoform X1 [Solea senegalensis]